MLSAGDGRRDGIRGLAASDMGWAPAEVGLLDGKAQGPAGRAIALAGLADAPISFEGSFLNKKHTYAYGAHAAHVAVDLKLGHVALVDYVAVEDCGRIINPMTLPGQVISALVQAPVGAFLDNPGYDEPGQVLTAS